MSDRHPSRDVNLGSSCAPGDGFSTELFREDQGQGQRESHVVVSLSLQPERVFLLLLCQKRE